MDMQSTITDIDSVTRKATITIPSDKFSSELAEAVDKYSKQAKVKGFRPGKAPREMVEKMYGDSIRWDVMTKLVSQSLEETVKKHELQMVGSPKIDITKGEAGSDIEFTADFSIYPTPTIAGYEGVEVSVEKEEIVDDQINGVVKSYLKSKATLAPANGRTQVQAEDVIDVSVVYKGGDGGETASEKATIGLGDGQLPKEFDDQVLGMSIGEKRSVTIPNRNGGESLTYEVELMGIQERQLPDLTDDFVASLGIEEKTVLEMKTSIRKRMEDEAERTANERARNEIVNKLIEKNEFMVPQPLIDDEIRNLLIKVGAVDPKKTKFEDIPVEPFRGSFGEMATKRVKGTIVLDQVASQEKIVPNEDDLSKTFKDLAAMYRTTEAEARKMFTGRSLINLAVEVTRDKTQEFLVNKAKVSYTTMKK